MNYIFWTCISITIVLLAYATVILLFGQTNEHFEDLNCYETLKEKYPVLNPDYMNGHGLFQPGLFESKKTALESKEDMERELAGLEIIPEFQKTELCEL